MISRLIRLFLDAPVLALALALLLAAWGWQSFLDNPKDALPDIAKNQTIVFTEWMGRSPKDVDEQITYPLTTALQGVPGVKEVRATSGFGWSLVYVVFHDNIGFYWARTRVLERLDTLAGDLPDGVSPRLGPDATALGQVFWYTLDNGWYSADHPRLRFTEAGLPFDQNTQTIDVVKPSAPTPFTCPLTGKPLLFSRLTLDELRSIQDYDIKLALESVEGVAEVASVGGYVRQYQIDVSPEALQAFSVPLSAVVQALRDSNVDVGAKVIEENGMEVFVRGVGFLGGGERGIGPRRERERAAIADIESTVIKATDGTPVFIRQLAEVGVGPDFRRGALDKAGAEAVGGCVVMRFGENPLAVIERVKQRIAEIEPGLPPGVRINAFYDRTQLIAETMGTLGTALWQELLITAVAVVLFLLHFRSSLVIAVTLPLAVLFAFLCMQWLDVGSNIMSLAGIAIAIGTMVDMAIVMVENIHQHLMPEDQEGTGDTSPSESTTIVSDDTRIDRIHRAASEVGGAILTAVATTVISFLPVFFLEGQSAKLFTPLAWTKTFCLLGAVLMALFIVPPLAAIMLGGRKPSWLSSVSLSGAIAVIATWAWAATAGPGDTLGKVGETVRGILSIAWPSDVLLVAVVAFAICLAISRERIRPVTSNPVNRLINAAYRPLLRWVLAHKFLFFATCSIPVIWGLSIWLGLSGITRMLIRLGESAGLRPDTWSLALWCHLLIAAVVGFWIIPLLADTVVALVFRTRLSRIGRKLMKIPYLICFVLLLAGLNSLGFAGSHAQTVAALCGFSHSTTAETVESYLPLSQLAESSTGIGQEFMPPLDEGDFLYMPSVLPAGSINTVMRVMQQQNINFAAIDEVETVVGKLGRIDSALDPAPVGMIETVIALRPRSDWPLIDDPLHAGRRRQRTMAEIWSLIQQAGQYPGVLPSVELQPIRTRVEMLSTGFNAKIGVKVYGDSIVMCEQLATEIEQVLRTELEGAQSISAIRTNGKPYIEFHIDREAIARYGVRIRDVQDIIEVAIGGKNLTSTYEGLDRYPVRLRYQRELRDEFPDLQSILVPTPSGAQIPIIQVADIRSVVGPMSLRREGAEYVSYVTMNNSSVDETTLVRRGQRTLREAIADGRLAIPDGYHFKWSGSYERNVRAKKRLSILVPLVLLINLFLIYLQFRRISVTCIVFLVIPVSFSGGFILLHYWPEIHNWLYLLGLMDRGFEGNAMYLTVAVWVGFIALFGIAVDDGIVMSTYLEQAFARKKVARYSEIRQRVIEAGLRRIRPCLMTTLTTLAALAVVLISTGRGSDVMVPMAIPIFGGMIAAGISIFIVPTCYCALKEQKWRWGIHDSTFYRKRKDELD